MATKLEAFSSRGRGDYLMSHDLEDVMAVVDGRPELYEELSTHEPEARTYIAQTIRKMLDDPRLREALPGYLPGDEARQQRLNLLAQRLERIAERK